MSQMLTNIKRVVEEDVSNRTTQMDALIEAITNSIQANATKIICRFETNQAVLDESEIAPHKVSAIEIEDNGDGFNDLNYKSFGKYRSDYNAALGCKGVGRFVFLKLFKKVEYTSWLAGPKKKRGFSFTFDFESDNLGEEDADVSENRTLLRLSGVTTKYFTKEKQIERRLDLNISQIRDKALMRLIPMLFFKKQSGVIISIDFCDSLTATTVGISQADIPAFEKNGFLIKGSDATEYPFTLYYRIAEGKGSLNAFHCANGRTVCEFSEKDLKISLPRNYNGYLLIVSDYFDRHVNNERNEFEIFPIQTDAFNPLSWEIINAYLKNVVSSLVKERIPDAIKMNRDQILAIQEERPYLSDYIEPEDLDIAGFIDKGQIIKKAKKRFDESKERLLSHAGKSEYTDRDLQDAIEIAQNELVAYVKDRVLIIERLNTMLKNKEQSERTIHNLLMERHTEDDYFCIGKNNLWLLDDRFTSYTYAASDKKIKEILRKFDLEDGQVSGNDDRPDLALFFSHDPVNKQALKSVLVELKPFKDEGKSDRDKFAGIQQLLDYIRAFKANEDVREIWAFLVTDVDDKFAERLRTNEFTPLFSTDKVIYFRHYEGSGFIYVLGVQTLIADAEARNRIFIEIIKKHSRLNRQLLAQLPANEK